jgi:hypothetical protein
VRNRNGPFQGPLFGLAPDEVFRASALALGAVGSYPAFSPLPPASNLGPEVDGGLFSVALSIGTPFGVTSRVYPTRGLRLESRLRGIAPCGVRTFLLRLPRTATEAILRPSKTGKSIQLTNQ